MNPSRYLPRPLPDALENLAELALDLRWNWNRSSDRLWERLDPDLWDATGNPWLILETVSQERLEALAQDGDFIEELAYQWERRQTDLKQETWFSRNHSDHPLGAIAYFSMEFGLSEALPIYSGGLGMLAGDHLKTASDLGIPLVAVGLLFQQGYFRQALDANGEQIEFFPYNDPAMLPVMPLRTENGEWLQVAVELPGRTVTLKCWQAQVGRIPLYLLDSNDLLNSPGDRGITGELYGGGPEMRLQQEIVLGIGGWQLLQALDIECSVCHLNEGHAAFVVLERARTFMAEHDVSFEEAMICTRAGNLFTTHTPVAAGFDRFAPDLFSQYFEAYAQQLGIDMKGLLDLGRTETDNHNAPFNMAYLAMNGSCHINGVSRLHGKVSRQIFQSLFPRWPQREVPVSHVTNGVHMPSWDSAEANALWSETSGEARWLDTLETLESELKALPDKTLWDFRGRGRRNLIAQVRRRTARQSATHATRLCTVEECACLLDPDTLTLGFARRFATYKRPNLLLHDPARLTRLLTHPQRPVQLILAGKAHPQDREGKRMVREWNDYLHQAQVGGHVVFLEDYDMALASELVAGVDVWVNTPRRPWEASGTSGMKVLPNGGLNLSELDGWWAEAYEEDVGWAIGDGREHDADPAWDAHEAEQLYSLLEGEVVPAFYERNGHGIPHRWVEMMRESMARLTPQYSTNRMVREYTEHYYLPAASAYRHRSHDDCALGAEIRQWSHRIADHWERVHFGTLEVSSDAQHHRFSVQVYLGELPPDSVSVELYAEPQDGSMPQPRQMEIVEPLVGAANAFLFEAEVPSRRPAEHYTPRIVPYHPDVQIPLEGRAIRWAR